jgi:uncharacterized protein
VSSALSVFRGDTALITGASAGLGAEFARQLAAAGVAQVVLVARRLDRLEALRDELVGQYHLLKAHAVAADLQTALGRQVVLDYLMQQHLSVDLLINNAGLGDMGSFTSAAWPKLALTMEVNVIALTAFTHALLPSMIARKKGRIVNLGSIAGYAPLPDFAVYAATKAYVNSFSEALHWELYGTGVTVTAVCPGPIPTEFFTVAARTNGKRKLDSPTFFQITAQTCVRQALSAAAQGQPRIVTGWIVRVAAAIMGQLPLWWLRTIYRWSAQR